MIRFDCSSRSPSHTRVDGSRSGGRNFQVLQPGLQLTFDALKNVTKIQTLMDVPQSGDSLASSFFDMTSSSRRSRSSETSFSSCFLAFESS